MASYCDGLRPDVTVGEVFYDVYTRVESKVSELNRGRKAAGEYSPRVPGTRLVMKFSAGSDNHDGWYKSTGVAVSGWDNDVSLVAHSVHRPRGASVDNPAGVRGNRGNELGGDYSLSYTEFGLVECRLGQLGLWGTGQSTEDPVGSFRVDQAELVRRLQPVDRARISIVSERVIENLAVVELLQEGADPAEALAMIGRQAELSRY
jgi:hypothetical protein